MNANAISVSAQTHELLKLMADALADVLSPR